HDVQITESMIRGAILTDTCMKPISNAVPTLEHFRLEVVPRLRVLREAGCDSIPVFRVEEIEVILYGFPNGNLVESSLSLCHASSSAQSAASADRGSLRRPAQGRDSGELVTPWGNSLYSCDP